MKKRIAVRPFRRAYNLLFALYSSIVLNNYRLKEICDIIRYDPILSQNEDLMERINKGELTKETLPFIEKICNSF